MSTKKRCSNATCGWHHISVEVPDGITECIGCGKELVTHDLDELLGKIGGDKLADLFKGMGL